MKTILTILLVILGIALTGIILIQPHKSEGITDQKVGAVIFGESSDGGPIVKVTTLIAVAMVTIIIVIRRLA